MKERNDSRTMEIETKNNDNHKRTNRMKRQRKCTHSLRKSHFRRNKLIRGKTGGHCAKYTVVRKGDANSCALMKNEVEVKMNRSICAVYWPLKKE